MHHKISNALLIAGALMLVLWGCGSSEEGVALKGKITNPVADRDVVLSKYGSGGLEPVDTIAVSDGGEFETKVKVTEPTFFRLSFYGRKFSNIILTGEESKVEVAVDIKDVNAVPTVTGSPETEHLKVFDELTKNMKDDEQMLRQQAMEARTNSDQSEMQSINDEFTMLLDKYYADVKAYANKIKPSIAVFYGISSINPENNFEFYEELADFYGKELPNHFFTKDLVERIDYMKALSVGSDAPEISMETPEGEVLSLSDLKGKYVLIDFWAAWCGPCRRENPNVVRMYNQYKGENFEILGVSLDKEKEKWLKAIDDDGLIWKHVSDLQYFNSAAAKAYKVNSIPMTYLIGPDGKIVAKGLRGPSLEAKLKEIFG